jgi:predicted enzyme related to lactoylglutathione lyase
VSGAARNPFGHIDLRVSSMQAALPFYEALLPDLGFYHRPPA